MSWRAWVLHEDRISDQVHLVVGRRLPGETEVVSEIGPVGVVCTRTPEAAAVDTTLRIPRDMAQALLDGLAQYFGGTGDARQLRKDYDAERRRVDKAVDALITIASAGATKEAAGV